MPESELFLEPVRGAAEDPRAESGITPTTRTHHSATLPRTCSRAGALPLSKVKSLAKGASRIIIISLFAAWFIVLSGHGLIPSFSPAGIGRRAEYITITLSGGNPFLAARETTAGRTGEALWYAFGIPSFVAPAIVGSLHARHTQRQASQDAHGPEQDNGATL